MRAEKEEDAVADASFAALVETREAELREALDAARAEAEAEEAHLKATLAATERAIAEREEAVQADLKVRVQIIRHARTHYVGNYQVCMF